MQIQLITVAGSSPRWAPEWRDRAWLLMENAGSGADGASQARAGDATCLKIVSTTTYDEGKTAAASVGYEALECTTATAPPQLLLGAWHDTPEVGKFGRVQCSGWDHDALVSITTAATAPGLPLAATTGQPHIIEDAAPSDGEQIIHGYLATCVELAANMSDTTVDNISVYWRAC